MGNPTNQQTLEQIEGDLERMKNLFSEQVTHWRRMSNKQRWWDIGLIVGGADEAVGEGNTFGTWPNGAKRSEPEKGG